MKTAVIGYPYIGVHLEWQELLEEFLGGELEEKYFEVEMHNFQLDQLSHQKQLGLDILTIGDFTYYSRMTDLMLMFHMMELSPNQSILENYRNFINSKSASAKQINWFSTMYKTNVPFYTGQPLALKHNFFLDQLKNVQQEIGVTPRLSIIGPFTFVRLTDGIPEKARMQYIEQVGLVYKEMLSQLAIEGLTDVQFEEPILTVSLTQKDLKELKFLYQIIHEQLPLEIMLTTYFESVLQLEELLKLPITGIGLDFVAGKQGNVSAIKKLDFSNKTLAVGIVNGQNIWKTDVTKAVQLIRELRNGCSPKELVLQTSTSLQFVPYSISNEPILLPALRNHLAFADEKIAELSEIKQHLIDQTYFRRKLSKNPISDIEKYRKNELIAEKIAQLQQQSFKRASANSRKKLQQLFLQLPKNPLTLVRLPETVTNQSSLSKESNERVINAILFQKQLGLDVFLYENHHSFQMVEECTKHIEGIFIPTNSFVVQTGHYCIKPPIVYGDLYNREGIFSNDAKIAQKLTDRKLKIKLPGPMMMLQYTFLREDIDEVVVQQQMALILQQELIELEKMGIYIIQIEEFSIFQQLPFRKMQQKEALSKAVQVMNIMTTAVRDTTQIHLHLYYEDIKGFSKYLLEMNGDVYVIENMPEQQSGLHMKSYPIETSAVINALEMDNLFHIESRENPTQWITLDISAKELNRKKVMQHISMLQNLKS